MNKGNCSRSTALGESYAEEFSDRGSTPLASTIMRTQKRCVRRKARFYRAFLLPKRRFCSAPKCRCQIAVFPLRIDSDKRKTEYPIRRQIEIKNLSAFLLPYKKGENRYATERIIKTAQDSIRHQDGRQRMAGGVLGQHPPLPNKIQRSIFKQRPTKTSPMNTAVKLQPSSLP